MATSEKQDKQLPASVRLVFDDFLQQLGKEEGFDQEMLVRIREVLFEKPKMDAETFSEALRVPKKEAP